MAPLTPHWKQPSHPDIQDVVINEQEFTSKSLSKVSLPPFGLYAKMDFPPCTLADKPTYATVQIDQDKHLNLNSDLLYINHSCEPSLIFDTANLNILAGPNGLKAGEELTFFYPSSEWSMDQPFDCLCGKPTCRGRIAGAKDMSKEQLEGLWINGHIHKLLELKAAEDAKLSGNGNHFVKADRRATEDPTAQALRDALKHAEKVVEAAQLALHSYIESAGSGYNGASASRRGPTSRELSGEMGGDTVLA
ncbi:hypothetical protein JX265_006672 [Neoarthrinium moseri]|uniref:Post-SET domain-containing protein n=1 Tax=Neoarthrinium moseri TaxID=1658444 RepID=A0A9Q0ALU7_9PEZI|nr:hypothetical protein JX265_006672 [Neoarthrinium moseri]